MNAERPFLVALEGIDGAGKATQAARLRDFLAAGRVPAGASSAPPVSVRSYPVYGSFFGREIRRMLDGVDGPSAAQVDPRSMALWYALDRQDDLRRHPLEGAAVVLNRFTLSNAVYQSARSELDDGDAAAADEVFTWVLALEQQHLGLPVPDLTVVLDVPPELSYERADARARSRRDAADVYERAGHLLKLARSRYLRAEEADPGSGRGSGSVVVVPCADEGGVGRSVDDVHADICTRVQQKIDPNIRSAVVSRR